MLFRSKGRQVTKTTETMRRGKQVIKTETTIIEPREIGGIMVDRLIVETRTVDGESSHFFHLSDGTRFIPTTATAPIVIEIQQTL